MGSQVAQSSTNHTREAVIGVLVNREAKRGFYKPLVEGLSNALSGSVDEHGRVEAGKQYLQEVHREYDNIMKEEGEHAQNALGGVA